MGVGALPPMGAFFMLAVHERVAIIGILVYERTAENSRSIKELHFHSRFIYGRVAILRCSSLSKGT